MVNIKFRPMTDKRKAKSEFLPSRSIKSASVYEGGESRPLVAFEILLWVGGIGGVVVGIAIIIICCVVAKRRQKRAEGEMK